MKEYISAAQAAELARVTTVTIYNLYKSGAIGYLKKGPHLSFLKDDVIKLKDKYQEYEALSDSIDQCIAEYKTEFQKNKEILDDIKDEVLCNKVFCNGMKLMQDVVCAEIYRYRNALSERDFDILYSVFSGKKNVKQLSEQYDVSSSLIVERLHHAVRLFECIPTELQERDNTIKELKQQIKNASNLTQEYDEYEQSYEYKNLMTPVMDLALPVRVLNVLRACEIEYVWQLVDTKPIKLIKYRNFGKKSLEVINDFLASVNLKFGADLTKFYKCNKFNGILY